MANDEWAIIVGINNYPDPEIGSLQGPETDALEFYRWVTNEQKLPVPNPDDPKAPLVPGVKQAKLILASHFGAPATSAINAEPTAQAVYKAFDELDEIAEANSKAGRAMAVGERLYLYFSGHGFEPVAEEAVLLMANATRRRLNYHVPGRVVANAFYRSGYFKEVILLMDCCRDSYPSAHLNVPPFVTTTAVEAAINGKRFFGFGTKWSRKSRERVFGNTTRGVFSVALMDALRGAAAEPNGNVTANSLGNWLYNNMQTYLEPVDLDNPDIPKEPDLVWDRSVADFVIAKTTPKKYALKSTFAPNLTGQTVSILAGGDLAEIDKHIINGGPWTVQLETGKYLVLLQDGQRKVVVINGKGAVDVSF